MRLVSGLAASFFVTALAASCANTLNLDGYSNSVETLCDLVNRCYGKDLFPSCREDFTADLSNIDDETAKDLLTHIDETGCLSACSSSRKCLDIEPFCVQVNEIEPDKQATSCAVKHTSCDVDEECCGFSKGLSECVTGQCCKAIGVECCADEECCPNAGLCEKTASGKRHCGGVVCGAEGESCLNNFQCCSGLCVNQTCSDNTCQPAGFECFADADCCDKACLPSEEEGDTKRCQDPPCATQGEACTVGGTACCPKNLEGDALSCIPTNGNDGFCNTDDCRPLDFDCGISATCCSGFCHQKYNLCGLCEGKAVGAACSEQIPCCLGFVCGPENKCEDCDGQPCAEPSDCCEGYHCADAACTKD